MRRVQAEVAPRHQKREDFRMPFVIRPLRADEAETYRDIRLEALRLHPEAFGSSFEEESARGLAWFAERLSGTTVFGGFRGEALLGTAGFMPETGLKRAHKGHLWGMYLRAEARGSGLAAGLVAAVVDHARGRVEVLLLSVTEGNVPARRLYETFGFVAWGVEVKALRVEGVWYDDVHMGKWLG
jgi:RimJ/RimL family protein N-acetyltransferase